MLVSFHYKEKYCVCSIIHIVREHLIIRRNLTFVYFSFRVSNDCSIHIRLSSDQIFLHLFISTFSFISFLLWNRTYTIFGNILVSYIKHDKPCCLFDLFCSWLVMRSLIAAHKRFLSINRLWSDTAYELNRRLLCLLNCWAMRRSRKTSKLRVTGLYAGNSPVTGEFPAQRVSNAENVSIWWRHHVSALGQIIAWRLTGDNPLHEPLMWLTDVSLRHSVSIEWCNDWSRDWKSPVSHVKGTLGALTIHIKHIFHILQTPQSIFVNGNRLCYIEIILNYWNRYLKLLGLNIMLDP